MQNLSHFTHPQARAPPVLRHRCKTLLRSIPIHLLISERNRESTMRLLTSVVLALAVIFGGVSAPALAGDMDPLFVNFTSDEAHRVNMALDFGREIRWAVGVRLRSS
jgi:hypothetical protein